MLAEEVPKDGAVTALGRGLGQWAQGLRWVVIVVDAAQLVHALGKGVTTMFGEGMLSACPLEVQTLRGNIVHSGGLQVGDVGVEAFMVRPGPPTPAQRSSCSRWVECQAPTANTSTGLAGVAVHLNKQFKLTPLTQTLVHATQNH